MNTHSYSHIQWTRARVFILTVSVSLVLVLLGAGEPMVRRSQAAFPGENGKLVYSVPIGTACSDSSPTYLINPDGTGKISAPVTGFRPVWSPDGSKIAYYRDNYIHVANADGSEDVALVQGDEPAWSPDGKMLAFSRITAPGPMNQGLDLFIIDLETKQETRLTHDAQDGSGTLVYNRFPTWHPEIDKHTIAYLHYEWRSGSGSNPVQGVWTIYSDGKGSKPLVKSEATAPDWEFPQWFWYPDWAPNGKHLVVTVRTPEDDPPYLQQIVDVSYPDGILTPLSPKEDTYQYPTWSPDGTKIAFISPRGGYNQVWVMNASGEGLQQVTDDKTCSWVSWQLLPEKKVFVVNSAQVMWDNDVGDGECDTGQVLDNGDKECTLHAAIVEANYDNVTDTIIFDIPGSGVPRIKIEGQADIMTLEYAFEITQPVIIDATTQPGSGRVEIEGPGFSLYKEGEPCHPDLIPNNCLGGFKITAGNSILRGLVIHSFNTWAVVLTGDGGNVLEGNYIGVDPSGMKAIGNGAIDYFEDNIEKYEGGGLLIESGNNQIGGADHTIGVCDGTCNLISGNNFATKTSTKGMPSGITIRGSAATNNHILGNFIGTDVSGQQVPPGTTQYFGIVIEDVEAQNWLEKNVISGNLWTAIAIEGGGYTVVKDNFIGTDAGGIGKINDSQSTGIDISNSKSNEIEGNVISGFSSNGVLITGANSVANYVGSNLIGTTADGNFALGNAVGVFIRSAEAIGAPVNSAIRNNTIAFNNIGVYLLNGANGSTIDDNIIHDNGISIWVEGTKHIGVEGNTIYHNDIGMWVVNSPSLDSTGIRISANSIYENQRLLRSGLGIDLAPEGPTLNDQGDLDSGPNNLLNFPVLGFATATSDGNLRITGSFDTGLGSKPYTIELFANQACDESGYGEGERFLGYLEVTTDFAGHAPIETTFTQSGVTSGQFITATAIDQEGNTSEFSRCVEVQWGTTLSANAKKGTTVLQTSNTQGFAEGDFIRVNPGGENQEDNRVMGFGSLRLATPLQFDHASGELVVIVTKRLYLPLALKQPVPP